MNAETLKHRLGPLAAVVVMMSGVAQAACAQAPPARFATEHEWMGRGIWVRGDTHMHSTASDGAHEIGPLVERARQNGCEVVGITDHADRQLRAATGEYIGAIGAARAANPGMVVVAGLEWNVPPYGGREHATLLVPDDPNAGALLAEFKRQFDDYDLGDRRQPDVRQAFEWLVDAVRDLPVKPVVIYNHPSRKDATSRENLDDMVAWRAVNDLAIGFEGAPGHQGKPPLGSYGEKEPTIDRWDPVVARPGDVWDQMLQQGYDVVGAVAGSDFHTENPNDLGDYWPCQFSETWLYVPERTTAGVLQALRAGTFYGVHGHIVRNLEMTALVEGLDRAVGMGEAAQVAAGTEVPVVVAFDVPATDWQQQPNRVDTVEFIIVRPSGVETRTHKVQGGGTQTAAERVSVGQEGVVVRARIRREIADGPDLMAYTNAIRLRAR
jgi:hypothetical protein